jgi:hypothetical protein
VTVQGVNIKDVEKSQGKCFYEPLPRTTRIKRVGEAGNDRRKKREETLDDFVDGESDPRVTITTTTTTTTTSG